MKKAAKRELIIFILFIIDCIVAYVFWRVCFGLGDSGRHLSFWPWLVLNILFYGSFLFLGLYPLYLLARFLTWLLTRRVNIGIAITALLEAVSFLYYIGFIRFLKVGHVVYPGYPRMPVKLFLFLLSVIPAIGIFKLAEWARKTVIICYVIIALIATYSVVFGGLWTITPIAFLMMFPWLFFLIFFTHPLVKEQFK
jgi:hypothetical protein